MLYKLVEKTEGPHKGKIWRTEDMTPEQAAAINATIQVMKWEPAEPAAAIHNCPTCGAKEGEPCRTPAGRKKASVHDTRKFSLAF